MAALPGNNTAVLYLDYTTCGENHTGQYRFAAPASVNDAMNVADAFYTAISAALNLVNIRGARVRDAGGAVSYPVTWTGASSYGGTGTPHEESAYYISFVGRSLGGHRNRVFTFGYGEAADVSGHDFRVQAADSTLVAAALAVLESTSGTPCAIDGDDTNWHQYANLGVNAYWRNKIR